MEHLDWIEHCGARDWRGQYNRRRRGTASRLQHGCGGLSFRRCAKKVLSLRELRCAVIGAGGAARSALWGLRQEGARVTLFARDVEKARPVAEKFGADCEQLDGASFSGFDVGRQCHSARHTRRERRPNARTRKPASRRTARLRSRLQSAGDALSARSSRGRLRATQWTSDARRAGRRTVSIVDGAIRAARCDEGSRVAKTLKADAGC